VRPLTLSLVDRSAEPGLVKIRKVEEQHARTLRRIASQIGDIINGWAPADDLPRLSDIPALQRVLSAYSLALEPWAKSTATRMMQEIAIRDRRMWAAHAKDMSKALKLQLESAPMGQFFRQRIAEHAAEITSLPTEAGRRVYELTSKGLLTGGRPASLVEEIRRSGDVSASRATMLARTAVSSTAEALVETRARSIGSTGYIWRTARDSDVRPSHKAMEGKFVAWNDPPTLDGYTAHAGCYANCRCRPEPVLPEW
jgi:SPP1 gp7 family putative phage head morphogenesis protein